MKKIAEKQFENKHPVLKRNMLKACKSNCKYFYLLFCIWIELDFRLSSKLKINYCSSFAPTCTGPVCGRINKSEKLLFSEFGYDWSKYSSVFQNITFSRKQTFSEKVR